VEINVNDTVNTHHHTYLMVV